MAENLLKEELPIEKQEERKKLYKSWKLYASALGIIAVGAGTGVGIYYGVTNNATNSGLTDQEITTEINKVTTYQILANVGDINSITQIDATFIKTKLTNNTASAFNVELFKFNKITIGDDKHQLTNSDLENPGSITAQINYNYGSLENQITNLTITVSVSDTQIIKTINETKYELNHNLGDEIAILTTKINPEFIKSQLKNENISNAFNVELFKFNKITTGDDKHQLTNSDLENLGSITTQINYTYNSNEIQTTNLTINVITISSEEIINTINETKYELNHNLGDEIAILTTKINPEFIKSQLKNENISNAFNEELFTFKNITTIGDDKHELTNDDLGKVQTVATQINYTYNSNEIQTTNLTITIELDLRNKIDISKLVTDKNRNLTLQDVTINSSDTEIKTAILKAIVPIVQDIVGPDLSVIITDEIIGSQVSITLDENSPHKGATITAKDDSMFIKGSVEALFELQEAK